MTNENKTSLEKVIWRIIPVEARKLSYVDQMDILGDNFSFNGITVGYQMPAPKNDFEKATYSQFFKLLNSHCIPGPAYVVPLLKEFVIDNKQNEASLILRYQMDFAIGKGFHMKEMVFHGKNHEEMKEVYEDHRWVGPTPNDLFTNLIENAKLDVDPMLYVLKGSSTDFLEDVDLHNLDMDDKQISFVSAQGKKIQINK